MDTVYFVLMLISAWFSPSICQEYHGAKEVLSLVNKARASEGKPALCLSKKLMDSAKSHTNYQANIVKRMQHEGPKKLVDRIRASGYAVKAYAENVGESHGSDVPVIVKAFLKSAHHRLNIMGEYTHFGTFALKSPNGKWYWTQHFGKSDGTEPCDYGTFSPGAMQAPAKPSPSSTTPAKSETEEVTITISATSEHSPTIGTTMTITPTDSATPTLV